MPKVVFITRGHGFGHAARDLLVIEAMRRALPHLELVLAASGTGAEYYRRRGVDVVDLGIPDSRDTGEEAGKAVWQFLSSAGPVDLVVVDEVMWALPICRRLLKVPCVLITDWFYSEIGLPDLDRTMNQASAIIVTDFAEAHRGVVDVTVPLHFPGPLVKPFDLPRDEARRELGLDADAFTAVLTLGGMPDRPDARTIADLVIAAWRQDAGDTDRLVVLADRLPGATADPQAGRAGTGQARTGQAGITWVGVSDTPERYFRAADVVLADAAGFTVCELTRHGVPTVAVKSAALSAGVHARLRVLEEAGLVHPVDAGVGPQDLSALIRRLRDTPAAVTGDELGWADADAVAALVLEHLPVPASA
jgi:predicted glycosyltransferase